MAFEYEFVLVSEVLEQKIAEISLTAFEPL
jgi:hypothetical protein